MIEQIKHISFHSPWFLLALLFLPLIYFFKKKRQKEEVYMLMSTLQPIKHVKTLKSKLLKFLPLLQYLALALAIIALARPQLTTKEEKVKAEGIDIMLVMDLSSSMLSQDFNPNRLEVSKQVAKDFIDKRPYDRIGLVVFSGESFTQTPVTTDHNILKDFLDNLQVGMIEDGTAIGMGLATAVNRLKDLDTKSKIIILLTDGDNNAGYIQPKTAAEIAQELNVKVYTIGVGSEGFARSPINRLSDGRYVFGNAKVKIDEQLLTEISNMTHGKYFRATNERSLQNIYDEIDKLEKTEIETNVFKRYEDLFHVFLLTGLLVMMLYMILKLTYLRNFAD
ncbi:MAG TPA: VWA domain-containing protein [Saprospiraceae bacterium]|nr:VWA domain-containing protein [Saprospiraceae bacterium]